MPILPSAHSLRRIVCPLVGCLLLVASPAAHAQQAQSDSLPQLDARKPFARWSQSVHTVRDSLVAVARAQVGTKYVLGGTSPTGGFDCSGLVKYVMAALRVELPRTAAQQARVGSAITRDENRLRPGDLLTFGKSKGGVSHIGIYVGEGRYIHASSVAGRVIESSLYRTGSPLIKKWRGARRVVSGADSASIRDGDG